MNDQPVIQLVTLGCSKNIVDSEYLMKQLEPLGYRMVHEGSPERADYVIINTCGFIHDAIEESVNTILQYARARRAGSVMTLIVMGCLSERYRGELLQEIPEIDHIFGVYDLQSLLRIFDLPYKKEWKNRRRLQTPSHYAYLKISEGCDRKCSFCAIPLIKGGHHSKPVGDLVEEASYLVREGVKELNLIAQDLSSYGKDLKEERSLPGLLAELEAMEDLEWIRLLYAYPSGFPSTILDMMIQSDKICPYLDIPLQHIDDRVLKNMYRGTTGNSIRRLLDRIRSRVPGIALRTTLLTGFPGEDEKAFEKLLDFVKEQEFERLGVFTYSEEEGTLAAKQFKDTIPLSVKEERAARIMDLQQEIAEKKNRELVGKTLKVLVDGREGDYYLARTAYDAPEVDQNVLISTADYNLKPGNFYTVEIKSAAPFDLYAAPV